MTPWPPCHICGNTTGPCEHMSAHLYPEEETMDTTTTRQTHNYTIRGWGHDFIIHKAHMDGYRLSASGWGAGITEGDYLILPNGERTTRYQVDSIRYMADPTDQWFAELRFEPRSTGES